MRARGLGSTGDPPDGTAKRMAESVVTARQKTCRTCDWNTDWTCQHIGCSKCPGAQKRMSAEPLKHLLADPFFRCPLNKFNP
jgi:hypothetical protein